MFTHKDIQNRSLFVINGTEHQYLKVVLGQLVLKDSQTDTVITKIPFPKILGLLVIGHTTVTTALIEHCNKHAVPLVVMKPNFRPVFYFGNMAEANYLLRKKQYQSPKTILHIAKVLIRDKINNQHQLLLKTREKNENVEKSKSILENSLVQIEKVLDYKELMGIEGKAAEAFFQSYFACFDWKQRLPRVKPDPLNATLDIGYTMLFNYLECMTRLFGFDPYVGVYHQCWFRRKSLVCDLVEPFRCIIDHQIRKSLNYGTFKPADFEIKNHAYILKRGMSKVYTKTFFEAIIQYKVDIFKYIQQYYRAFMGDKDETQYPRFIYQ